MSRPTFSVVLPTYRRPEHLEVCLAALLKQSWRPIEVCVGRRENDEESARVLAEYIRSSDGVVREAVVGADGNLVASLDAALTMTTGDLVALTDDDAEAPPDWLAKCAEWFEDGSLTGVGGRDDQPVERWDEAEVGVLKWWGKVVGNHHLGAGPPRDVDLLKGVNCCYRGDVLRATGFERALRGSGNVSNWEMYLCFRLRREGRRLIYDPALKIDHHVGPRRDGDVNARGGFERASFVDGVHNAALSILANVPWGRRVAYRVWRLAVGTRAEPGFVQVVRLVARGAPLGAVASRYGATREGTSLAEQTYRSALRTRPAFEKAPSRPATRVVSGTEAEGQAT